jgi:EmrB/QacA subfamily drug resistance transporter
MHNDNDPSAPGRGTDARRDDTAGSVPPDAGEMKLRRIVPVVLAVALFMEQMDSTVIATSLPAIAHGIGTTPVALKLALTSYLLSLAIFIPISGWMADRFGAKLVFRVAIAVFMTGSIACAISNSLTAFVVSRFLQGIGGAMMTPVGRLVLVRSTPKSDLVAAMSWLSVPALIGPVVGPPVGGFITTYFSWHWIFLINIPIGVAGIYLAGRVLPEMPGNDAERIDFKGFLLSAIAASGLVFGLSVVSLPALPPIVGIAVLLTGLASFWLYVRHARRTAKPILDPKLFRKPVFRSAILGGSLFRLGVGAIPFLLPLLLQVGFGLSPFHSGLLTFSSAFGALGMKFLATRALRAGGFRSILFFGSLVGTAFVAANGLFTISTPHWVIIAVLVTGGFVRSLVFTSINTLVFADLDREEASQGTAIAAVAQQISIALGVAVAGVFLEVISHVTATPVGAGTIATAFFCVAALTLFALIPFFNLSPDAGSTVSGHRLRIANASGAKGPAVKRRL